VAHALNPTTREVDYQEDQRFEASLGKKLVIPTISTSKLGVVVWAYHPSYTGSANRRIVARPAWAKKKKKVRPILKITKSKRCWGCGSSGRVPI
jgi:hypothetical protein